jgi:hypothetical protein
MNEFTRIQWVSQEAKDVWQPRFKAISRMSSKVEIDSVIKGLRKVGMPNITLDQFNELRFSSSLDVHLLAVHNAPKVFHSEVVPFKEGEPFNLRTVIGSRKWVSLFLEAWNDKDEEAYGQMLGYPVCCTEFFMKHWRELGEKDLTWPMMNSKNGLQSIVAYPYPTLNPMYSKFGVRPIWHIPCDIKCIASDFLAESCLKLWDRKEREWLYEIYEWPVEWSALHGAAEIRSPVCKIITDTEYTATERTIQFPGTKVPKEGATGCRFPYGPEADCWSNNGFTSLKAMTSAHSTILRAANEAKDIKTISDPGCGNGVLLHKLGLMHVKVTDLYGFDYNSHAIGQGRILYPDIRFFNLNLFDATIKSDMVVFMPGRLLENPNQAENFVQDLDFRYLLLYGYSAYADKVAELKNKYWSGCEIKSWVINDNAVAMLLEKP